MNAIAGKRIVLTGAASGIGRALLPKLIAAGAAHILAADRDAAALDSTLAALKPAIPVQPVIADLGQQAGNDAVFAAADAHMGGVDTFIANAGFAYYEPFTGDWARLDAIFRVNVYAPLYALDQMRRRHADASPYTVAITASAMGKVGYPGYSAYSATKGALVRFADAYRWESPPTHEHVMMIYPIATRTAFFQQAGHGTPSTWPTQTADYVAGRIVRGLVRGAKAVSPSLLFTVSHWLSAPLPVIAPMQWIAGRQLRRWREGRGT